MAEYVHRRIREKLWTSHFWLSARNDWELETGFQDIAANLSFMRDARGAVFEAGVRIPHDDNRPSFTQRLSESIRLVKDWMMQKSYGDWLLVLDNYDDIRVQLQRFLPTIGTTGSVLMTSRDRRVIGSVTRIGFALSSMGIIDAKHLFLLIRGESDVSSPTKDDKHLERILRELQLFPLAISQVTCFIREKSPSTSKEYLGYLKPRSGDRERLMRSKYASF